MSIPPSEQENRGSLALGIGIAWACLIGGYVVSIFVGSALPRSMLNSDGTFVLLALLPWAAMIAFIFRFASIGKPRTAGGIGLGIVTILAVALLLVAACFSLFSLH